MKNRSHRKRLLDDVLSDADEFREQMLRQTLGHVRRRNRIRHATRAGLVLVVVLAGVWFGWLRFNRVTVSPPGQVPALPYTLVNSRPLPASQLVETRMAMASIVSSSPDAFAVVETRSLPDVLKEISDQELLAVLAGHPGVLIRPEPGRAELVLVNAADWDGFVVGQ